MKIKKVLNNNVVLVENDNNTEMIVMGKGIAFQKNRAKILILPKLIKHLF